MLFICLLANIEYCLEEKLEALVTAFDHNVCNAYSSRINIAVSCIRNSKVSDTILDKPRTPMDCRLGIFTMIFRYLYYFRYDKKYKFWNLKSL